MNSYTHCMYCNMPKATPSRCPALETNGTNSHLQLSKQIGADEDIYGDFDVSFEIMARIFEAENDPEYRSSMVDRMPGSLVDRYSYFKNKYISGGRIEDLEEMIKSVSF